MDSNTTFISKEGLQRFYARIYEIFANKNHTHLGDDIDPATTTDRGAVQPDGITIEINQSGVISVPIAGTNKNGLMSSTDKTKLNGIADNANNYSLPIATTSTLGGIKPDNTTVTVDGNGVLHGVEQTPVATTEQLGKVKPDGVGITIDTDGTIHNAGAASGDGSQAGPILSLSAKGWAEQSTTTGKNLLPNTATSQTVNGVTFTVNADGSITANGTATATINYYLCNSVTFPEGTYTISGAPSTTNNSLYNVRCEDASSPNTQRLRNDGTTASSNVPTGTIPANTPQALLIRIYNGVTVNNLTFYPQLELGSTATSYEPYTGGAPSPSPDYPQEIRVCRGRNLFSYGTTAVDVTTTYRSAASQRLTVTQVDSSALKFTACNGDYSIAYIELAGLDGTLNYAFSYEIEQNNTGYTPVLQKYDAQTNTDKLTISVYARNGSNVLDTSKSFILRNIQVELGSVATSYVPYGYVGMEVHGKNLIKGSSLITDDCSNGSATNAVVDVGFNGCKGLRVPTYSDGGAWNGIYINVGAALKRANVPIGTTVTLSIYVRTYTGEATTYPNLYLFRFTSDSVSFGRKVQQKGEWVRLSATKTVNEYMLNSSTARFEYDTVLTPATSLVFSAPQLEIGSSATDYEPDLISTIPIPLPSRGWVASLPDGTCDTLTLDGAGKVTWRKACEEVVFDGSSDESWNGHTKSCTVTITPKARSIGGSSVAELLCTHFIKSTPPLVDGGSLGISQWTSGERLWFSDGTGSMTVAAWKTWLSTHPVTVLYPLETPVTEDDDYIEMPEIPVGASISIPELDDLGVKYLVNDGASTLVSQQNTYNKATYATKEDLQLTEDAIVELTSLMESRFKATELRISSTQKAFLRKDANGYYENESITTFLSTNFDGKIYGYSEPKTTAITITKTGANAGLPNPTLGTLTTPGSSVYRNLGPFQWYAAKGYVDNDGVPHIKVIKGVDSELDWNTCTDNVWSLRPIIWYLIDESGAAVQGQVSDTYHQGFKTNPQAYLPDGTLRPYMLAPRHALGFENNIGVSKPGLKGYDRNVSHNSLITLLDTANTGYSGKSIYEDWYDKFMFRMIYGTKNSQSIMYGCANYNLQYHPTVNESDVKRVILSNANANNLLVGSTMMLGNQSTTNTDRNNVNAYNVFDGLKISYIETYDSSNKAVYFDTDTTFNTNTAYLLSTAPWHTGSCGDMDWDGTISTAGVSSGKEPMFFQGCELMNGNYEIIGDIILSNDGTSGWTPYINFDSQKETTSLTSDYISCGAALPTDSNDSWKYGLYLSDKNGLLYATQTGGSQSTGTCDGQYTNKLATTGTKEWLSLGSLWLGGIAGLSCVDGYSALSGTFWRIWSRLSGVGRSIPNI